MGITNNTVFNFVKDNCGIVQVGACRKGYVTMPTCKVKINGTADGVTLDPVFQPYVPFPCGWEFTDENFGIELVSDYPSAGAGYGQTGQGVTLDNLGNAYYTGYYTIEDPETLNLYVWLYVAKVLQTGIVDWVNSYGSNIGDASPGWAMGNDVTVDSEDNIYVVGGNGPAIIIKYSNDGTFLWANQYESDSTDVPGGNANFKNIYYLENTNLLYVSGSVYDADTNMHYPFIAVYDTEGNLQTPPYYYPQSVWWEGVLWDNVSGALPNLYSMNNGVGCVVDKDGTAYTSYIYGLDYYDFIFNTTIVSTSGYQITLNEFLIMGMTIDKFNNIYVVGKSYLGAGGQDVIVYKLSLPNTNDPETLGFKWGKIVFSSEYDCSAKIYVDCSLNTYISIIEAIDPGVGESPGPTVYKLDADGNLINSVLAPIPYCLANFFNEYNNVGIIGNDIGSIYTLSSGDGPESTYPTEEITAYLYKLPNLTGTPTALPDIANVSPIDTGSVGEPDIPILPCNVCNTQESFINFVQNTGV